MVLKDASTGIETVDGVKNKLFLVRIMVLSARKNCFKQEEIYGSWVLGAQSSSQIFPNF